MHGVTMMTDMLQGWNEVFVIQHTVEYLSITGDTFVAEKQWEFCQAAWHSTIASSHGTPHGAGYVFRLAELDNAPSHILNTLLTPCCCCCLQWFVCIVSVLATWQMVLEVIVFLALSKLTFCVGWCSAVSIVVRCHQYLCPCVRK